LLGAVASFWFGPSIVKGLDWRRPESLDER
jgi:hypothetical protein